MNIFVFSSATVEFEITTKRLQSYITSKFTNPAGLFSSGTIISTIIFLLDAVEVICGQSEVQLADHQTDGGELSSQRVPTLETHQLLLHLAP